MIALSIASSALAGMSALWGGGMVIVAREEAATPYGKATSYRRLEEAKGWAWIAASIALIFLAWIVA